MSLIELKALAWDQQIMLATYSNNLELLKKKIADKEKEEPVKQEVKEEIKETKKK